MIFCRPSEEVEKKRGECGGVEGEKRWKKGASGIECDATWHKNLNILESLVFCAGEGAFATQRNQQSTITHVRAAGAKKDDGEHHGRRSSSPSKERRLGRGGRGRRVTMATLVAFPGTLRLPSHRRQGPGALRGLPAAPRRLPGSRRRFRVSAVGVAIEKESSLLQEKRAEPDATTESDVFACPICYEPLIRKGPRGLNVSAIYRSGFRCQTCNKTFSSRDMFLDLTVTSGTREYKEYKPARTELFRSPLVSFLYERGWRQNFNWSGFPGPDEEFKMAQDYFKPVAGGLILDVSCGSGLFSRKFATSRTFSGVIALDFSENMLRQCYEFIAEDDTILNANLALVRADVSRLPFQSASVDAVHAGAALHCWPSPSNAIAEISRVLRSGGVFVGTTFLSSSINSPFSSGLWRPLRGLGQVTNSYSYFTKEEIEDLCRSCGLTNYTSKIDQAFIMFSGQKP
ncbi:hypothetical protein Taro_032297 [Colocasia esculenta]|uniref:Methyltransferase type 11 domain-containing protein n=1 Tax=Colocasia esculenta TaxID=4460 RepID=A0A843VSC4_COLES|nr:hypothetical protein [Colocasia esculenta]